MRPAAAGAHPPRDVQCQVGARRNPRANDGIVWLEHTSFWDAVPRRRLRRTGEGNRDDRLPLTPESAPPPRPRRASGVRRRISGTESRFSRLRSDLARAESRSSGVQGDASGAQRRARTCGVVRRAGQALQQSGGPSSGPARSRRRAGDSYARHLRPPRRPAGSCVERTERPYGRVRLRGGRTSPRGGRAGPRAGPAASRNRSARSPGAPARSRADFAERYGGPATCHDGIVLRPGNHVERPPHVHGSPSGPKTPRQSGTVAVHAGKAPGPALKDV